ncbi:MAG: type II secretion system protein [Phycisphaerae bacterium]|nr:type II secretion system protein [Phycisphaerae bacterium]
MVKPIVRQDATPAGRRAFTLIELLVVVAIMSLLLAILMPGLRQARTAAKIVKAHAELRGITLALDIYLEIHNDKLPPTRFSCSTRSAYQLPVELGQQQLLASRTVRKYGNDIDVVAFRDVFNPTETYLYRAPGPGIMNESILMEDASTLWIPKDFPYADSTEGAYWRDAKTSPVRYAVWSVGPDKDSPKLSHIPGRAPIPDRYWCHGASDTGVITHYLGRDGRIYMSP